MGDRINVLNKIYSALKGFYILWFRAAAAVYMRSALFLDFTQRRMKVSYRRFVTNYRTHIFKKSPRRLNLKVGPIGCLEMSVRNYHSTLRKITLTLWPWNWTFK